MQTPTRGNPSSPALVVYGAAFAALVIWAATPVATKIAVGGIDPLSVGSLRASIAGPVAGCLALLLRLPVPQRLNQRLLLITSGLASFAVWPMLLSLGIGFTSTNHAALIIALIPVFTGLFAAMLERRWPQLSWWTGIAIAWIGTCYLILYPGESDTSQSSVTGDLIVLSGVAICAIGYVTGGRLAPAIGTWATTFWGLTAAAFFLIPFSAFLSYRTQWASVSGVQWLSLFYLALGGSLSGYLFWYWALGRGGITRVSTYQFTQPLMTVVLSALILGERVTLPFVIAACVIIAGTALAQRPARE